MKGYFMKGYFMDKIQEYKYNLIFLKEYIKELKYYKKNNMYNNKNIDELINYYIKERNKLSTKLSKLKNRNHYVKYNKEYKKNNRNYINLYMNNYSKKNNYKHQNNYYNNHKWYLLYNDLFLNVNNKLSVFNKSISRKKFNEYLGVNINELKLYVEELLNEQLGDEQLNWDWDNYRTKWIIGYLFEDNIYDLNNDHQLRVYCHYSNIIPVGIIKD